jgi:hypothetical protein
MLFRETVAVYCENHTEQTNTVRTSQETHYFSAAEPNRLMLFGETVAVYCENHTEHTDTVRTSQETQYVSAAEPNRLMLFRETVSVYCENHTEHTDTLCGQNEGFWYVNAGGTYNNHWALMGWFKVTEVRQVTSILQDCKNYNRITVLFMLNLTCLQCCQPRTSTAATVTCRLFSENIPISQDITSCSPLRVNRRFGVTCHRLPGSFLYLENRGNIFRRNVN